MTCSLDGCTLTWPHGHGTDDSAWAAPAPVVQRVSGHCPQGCGETLLLGHGGHVTCSLVECPDPTSVDTLLDNPHIAAHIVVLTRDQRGEIGYRAQHPLAERINGDLLTGCPFEQDIQRGVFAEADLPGPGTYYLTRLGEGHWRWEGPSPDPA